MDTQATSLLLCCRHCRWQQVHSQVAANALQTRYPHCPCCHGVLQWVSINSIRQWHLVNQQQRLRQH